MSSMPRSGSRALELCVCSARSKIDRIVPFFAKIFENAEILILQAMIPAVSTNAVHVRIWSVLTESDGSWQ